MKRKNSTKTQAQRAKRAARRASITGNQNGVERRDFLKSSAAAGILAAIPASFWAGCAKKIQDALGTDGLNSWEGREVNVRTHHFDLSHLPNHDTFHFHMAGRVHTLVAHDDESYAKHAQNNHVMSVKPDAATHYAEDIEFLADCPVSWHVMPTRQEGELPIMALSGIHIPPQAITKAGEMLGDPDFSLGHSIYEYLEIEKPPRADKADATAAVSQDPTHMATWLSCAKALIYHHKDIVCLKGEHAAIAMGLIESRLDLMIPVAMKCQELGDAQGLGSTQVGWCNAVAAPNKWVTEDKDGNPVKGDSYTWIPDPRLKDVAATAAIHIRDLVQDHPHMKDVKYSITDGTHSNVSASPPAESKADGSDTGYSYKMEGSGTSRGAYTIRMVSQDPNNGVVEISAESHAPLYHTIAMQFLDVAGNRMENDAPNGYNETIKQNYPAESKYADEAAKWKKYTPPAGRGGNTNNHIILGKLDACDLILGIPVNLCSGITDYSLLNCWPNFTKKVPIPLGASKAKVLLLGPHSGSAVTSNLGTYFPSPGFSPHGLVDTPFAYTLPTLLTTTIQTALPTLLMAMGIAGYAKVQELTVILKDAVEGLIIGLCEGFFAKGLEGEDVWDSADFYVSVLHEAIYLGGATLAATLVADAAEEESEALIPLIGWGLFLWDIADTTAQLISVGVFEDRRPAVQEWDITISQNLQVTVAHDPNDYEYPAAATKMEVVLHYENDTSKIRTFKLEGENRIGQDGQGNDLAPVPINAPIIFTNQIAGGRVTATTTFLSDNDWVVGYDSKRVNNFKDAGWNSGPEVQIALTIKELLIPLVSDTKYSHKLELGADNDDSTKYAWKVTSDTPTSTVPPRGDADNVENAITSFNGLTFNQKTGQVGQCFTSKSTGIKDIAGVAGKDLSQVQNFNLNVDKGNGVPGVTFGHANVGHNKNSFLLYDLEGEATGTNARNYLLMPNATGEMHLRKIDDIAKNQVFETNPNSTDFETTHPSYGNFQNNVIIRACIDSSGTVAAVTSSNTLFVLDRPSTNSPNMANIVASKGTRRGGLDDIVSVSAIAKPHNNAKFIALEKGTTNGKPRLQALSQSGNPVDYFGTDDAGSNSHWFLFSEPGATGGTEKKAYPCAVNLHVDAGDKDKVLTYLDVSVESQGYIYVLSHIGDGKVDSDYRLDIYKPNGVHLVQQQGLRAASIAIDAFRNLFTQNHVKLTVNGQTSPTISQYIPSTPVPISVVFNGAAPKVKSFPGMAVESTIEFKVAENSGLEDVVIVVVGSDPPESSGKLQPKDTWSYPLMKAGTYEFKREGVADSITVTVT
jgi:hypothetical protein